MNLDVFTYLNDQTSVEIIDVLYSLIFVHAHAETLAICLHTQ